MRILRIAIYWAFLCLLNNHVVLPNRHWCRKPCQCVGQTMDCDKTKMRRPPAAIPNHTDTLYARYNRIRILLRPYFMRLGRVQHLLLSNNDIYYIQPTAFKDMQQLVSLSLENNRIKHLSPRTFRTQRNLRALSLRGNKLKNIDRLVAHTTKLYFLDFSQNRIPLIGHKTFLHNFHLRVLDLHENRIRHISRGALKGMPFIKYLVLRDNPLVEIDIYFRLNENIELLDLTKCRLQHIPRDLPPSVNDLRLAENFISNISIRDLQDTRKIRLLILSHNNISFIQDKALSDLTLLHDLFIDHNQLPTLPDHLPYTLHGLFAHHNNVTQLKRNILVDNPQLTELELSHNRISGMDTGAFRGLERLEKLKLSWNDITNISSLTFADNHRLQHLDLSHNPLDELSHYCFHGLHKLHILQLASIAPNPHTLQPIVFRDVQALLFLDLSHSPTVARKLTHNPTYISTVKDLNLMNDNLHNIPRDFPKFFHQLELIKLNGNPWHCNMDIYPLTLWMRNHTVVFYERPSLRCVTPRRLRGRLIDSLTLLDLGPPPASPPEVHIHLRGVDTQSANRTTQLHFNDPQTHKISTRITVDDGKADDEHKSSGDNVTMSHERSPMTGLVLG